MDTQTLPLLSPVLQAGAFGLCVLLIWLLRDVLRSNRQMVDGNTAAIAGNSQALAANTQAMNAITRVVQHVSDTQDDLRDRMLETGCPYLERVTDDEHLVAG